ncbi:hypothetical protein ACIQH6_24495 [Micromonospora orduensis]|uniref:hypothetical protein n=1 Tax=Micromonospora orduensis TaxID=1420891 RepID=UPI0038232D83
MICPLTGTFSPAPNEAQEAFTEALAASRRLAELDAPGSFVCSVGVAPGYAWLFGRDDGTAGEPDHVLVTTDAATWTRLTLSP